MPGYLGVPREKMRAVPLGINVDGYDAAARPRAATPFTIGFFARVAPEKGLHVLAEAYRRAARAAGRRTARGWWSPGYLAPEHREYLDEHPAADGATGASADEFEYRGELDRAGEDRLPAAASTCMSVPATYAEPKGIFLLEAMANGVPVVQPRRGAFPEILERTGGGLIVDAGRRRGAGGRAARRSGAIPSAPRRSAQAGAAGVREHYSVGRMAEAPKPSTASLMAGRREPAGPC